MIERVSVLSQKPTDILSKIAPKKRAFYFWLFDESLCLNIFVLLHVTMECKELNLLFKYVKKIRNSQDFILTILVLK